MAVAATDYTDDGDETCDYECHLASYNLAIDIAVYVSVACFCICSIAGVVGNGLVIWIAGFKMKTVSAVWFTNLAIVDFIYSVTLPFRIADWLGVNGHEFLYYTPLVMIYGNSISSVIFITVISIDRCVSVMWPLWAQIHRTRKQAAISSIFIWLVTAAIFILSWMFIDEIFPLYFIPMQNVTDFDRCEVLCDFTDPLMFVRSYFMFGVAFTITLVCYGLIVWELCSNPMRRPKQFQKTFRIIIAVVVLFFVCWFPYNMWPFFVLCTNMSIRFPELVMSCVTFCLVSISSCINPILYVLIGRKGGCGSKTSIRARIENSLKD